MNKTIIGAAGVLAVLACSIIGSLPKHLTMNVTYTVQAGDTMWDIATKYNGGDANTGEVIYEIEKYNHLTTDQLQPGQELQVPSPSAR